MELRDVDRVSAIEPDQFRQDYFKPLKPLIIEDLAKDWPATGKWTPEFFQARFPHKQVKVFDASFVDAGKNYMAQAKSLPMREYIDQVMNTSQDLRMFLYNIKTEIPELAEDILFPDLVDGISRHFLFMFFGCKASVTQMHFDIDMSHVFHTAIFGRKTVTLLPYEQGTNLHRYPFTCRSYVDVHAPDFEAFPRLKDAEGYRLQLQPGETLYIPSGYWHHFVYDEASCSISLRSGASDMRSRLLGLYNLLIMQSVDRVMNILWPKGWFQWKQQQALLQPWRLRLGPGVNT